MEGKLGPGGGGRNPGCAAGPCRFVLERFQAWFAVDTVSQKKASADSTRVETSPGQDRFRLNRSWSLGIFTQDLVRKVCDFSGSSPMLAFVLVDLAAAADEG